MPLARHDIYAHLRVRHRQVSTHMPLARHDETRKQDCERIRLFLLTCLLRGMTISFPNSQLLHYVSTHMPLARHDKNALYSYGDKRKFLLTCLLRGMTPLARYHFQEILRFLLTCLLRGMTCSSKSPYICNVCFYSHASCEA